MEIEIQNDVPMSELGYKGAPLPNYPKSGDYPWARMKEGDSFFIPLPDGGDIVRLMNRISGSACGRLGPGRVSTRCVKEGGRIGVRAWLISEA